jgi:uncharacterized SAM-binding protein YcdF (DUF218 family)
VSFAAKYVLQHLLLPPGIFVAVLLLLSLRWAARRQWEPGVLSLFLAAALYSLSIGPVADRLITGLEERYAIPARPEGDSIVLLGGGVYGQAADLTGLGFPSEEMLPRVVTAARLQRRLGVPVVVSGGKVFDHLDAEAPVVARVLSDLGVPREKILVEAKSRDTVENARRTKEILAGNGLRRPLLVTSAYHMRRAVAVFEKAGVTVTPVPAGFRTWKGKPYPWVSYLPSSGALLTSTNALREYLGLLYCRIAC